MKIRDIAQRYSIDEIDFEDFLVKSNLDYKNSLSGPIIDDNIADDYISLYLSWKQNNMPVSKDEVEKLALEVQAKKVAEKQLKEKKAQEMYEMRQKEKEAKAAQKEKEKREAVQKEQENQTKSTSDTEEKKYSTPITVTIIGFCGYFAILFGIILLFTIENGILIGSIVIGSSIMSIILYHIADDIHYTAFCAEKQVEQNEKYHELVLKHLTSIENKGITQNNKEK